MIEHVKALEGKDSRARGQVVLDTLAGLGITPAVERCRWPRIRNIVVDFASERSTPHLLLSAHYDAVRGCPAANDNGSGVAVLLEVCRRIREHRAPVRVVFFDREEAWFRTPLLRLGVLGSLYYAWRHDLTEIRAVYNLEFCGQGDALAVWPVKSSAVNLAAVQEVGKAAARVGIPVTQAHVPWFILSSDHLPFRLRGVSSSVSLSLVPAGHIQALKRLMAGVGVTGLLTGRRPVLPPPLSYIHTSHDTSGRLNEDSLTLMLRLVLELVRSHSPVPDSA